MQGSPRRARLGISLQFFTNASLFGTLLPHYPLIKDDYELSTASFGLVVVGFALGSIISAPFAGRFVRRLGALNVATAGTIGYALALAVAGWSPWLWLFVAGLVVAGLLDPILDTGQNVHGLRVERAYGSSIINSLHAVWSLGAVVGGLIGAWTVSRGWDVGAVMIASAIVWSLVAVGAYVLAHLPGPDSKADLPEEQHLPRNGRMLLLVAPLVLIAVSGTLVEEIGNSWAALYTRDAIGASAGMAGLAYVTAYAAQFVGRLAGDPLTDRFGRGSVATAGGGLIAVGALVTMLAPNVPVVLLGFALLGLGCATLVPAAYAAADDLPGLRHGTGVALVTWLMRLGFLVTSPLFGAIAQATSLRAGMVLPLLAGLAAAYGAWRHLPRSHTVNG